MPAEAGAAQQDAYRPSDHRSSSSRAGSEPTIPRPLETVARESAQRNVPGGDSSSSHGGFWSRPAAASIDLSTPASTPPSPSSRDSFISIVDDPFFQRLDSLAAAAAADTDTDANSGPEPETEASDENSVSSVEARTDSNDHKQHQRWLPSRRESLTIGPSQLWSHSTSAMESSNVAVIGATGVGKSSFVQRVLGLPRLPISNASNAPIVVDSAAHTVTLLELDLESFELGTSQPIQWPKQINGHIVPRVDAALVLYDVTNPDSTRELPQTLAALTNSGLPAMLVACKCDLPGDDWAIDADELADHSLFKSCLAHYKTSAENPQVARLCLQAIVRAAVAHRRDENGEMVSRRRAQSTVNLEAPDSSAGRPMSEGRHSRASSDFSLLRGFPTSPVKDSRRKQASRSPRPGLRIDRCGSDLFLDVDASDAESRRYSDDIPLLQRNDDVILEKQPKLTGVLLDDLVERLLALRLSKSEINFSDIFLCLYRKFATPGGLFSIILTRLDRVRDDKTSHHLTKTATQLRIIETVAKWVSLYPGDFARPATRRNLEEFIRHLSTEPIFCVAARQMQWNFNHSVIEDDDTGWANADADETVDHAVCNILSKEQGELPGAIGSLQFDDESSYGRLSVSSENLNRAGQVQLHAYDECEKEAVTLEPTDRLPMNKNRYRIFMDVSDDDVADELTRIDWIMFSSIRVRDFVRHVSLSMSQKESCKSLKNVNRMISHFNHIAKWVANMILLRDKAKHRALILEKFMNIAIKLRLLNNYNGLAAVLAGITGTAIHRLAQTRALVSSEVLKKFARLVILMGTQKSHFAYRLAWENSPLPRIPFIPLHRRDLVSAEEGSKTFVGPNGDRINWKKFEVLGEVLLPLMKSQGTSYPNLAKNDNVRELILGCRMPTDEEEIYQRSLEVESSGSGAFEPTKKIFPWFAK